MGMEMMKVLDPLVYFNRSVWGSFLYLYSFVTFDAAAWHVTTVSDAELIKKLHGSLNNRVLVICELFIMMTTDNGF